MAIEIDRATVRVACASPCRALWSLRKYPQAARDHNRSLMLRLVRDRGPISRAELARASFLCKPAVTDIVDGLIQHRLVRETVKGDAAVGHRS